MYTVENFKSKKAFKDAVKAGNKVKLWNPGIGDLPDNGTVYVSGPHYPKPHTWYAQVKVENGVVVKVS